MLFSSWLRTWKRSLERRSTRSQTRRRKAAVGRTARLAGRVRPRLEVLEDRLAPAVFTVNTTSDTDAVNLNTGQDSSGNVSLRSAIEASNSTGSSNTIQFAGSLGGQTITLNGTALPAISQSVTINGLGASNLAISGNHHSGIFILTNGQVSIAGVTIEDGAASNTAINNAFSGGGVNETGRQAITLTLNNCDFAGNSASNDGGAINCGKLSTISNCSFTNNSAGGDGGAIASGSGASISNCTFSGNSAANGGGVFNSNAGGGNTLVSNCTFSGNSASVFGGGIYNTQSGMTLIDSTVENNTDTIDNPPPGGANLGGGGGIFAGGQVTVSNSTVTGNTVNVSPIGAGSFGGGGLYDAYDLNVVNSTISNNTVSGPGSNGDPGLAAIWNPDGTLTVSGSTVSDNTGSGVYDYFSGAESTISDTTFSGNSGAGIAANGGTMTVNNSSILNNSRDGIDSLGGKLTVSNSNISGNTITSGDALGGGIWNEFATLKLSNSTISGNTGSGIANGSEAGTVTASSCSIFGNMGISGVGIYNVGGTLTLNNSTISNNTSNNPDGAGGGILNDGVMNVSNCTIAGNADGIGGGVYNADTLTVNDSTIAGNSGGGIANGGQFAQNGGLVTLNNTIVANNTSIGDLYLYSGSFTGSNDLIGDGESDLGSFSNLQSGPALLAPLGNYGGPTETMALLPGSPAIDAGSNALVPVGVTTDQRGQPRIVNGTVDIGAFESQGFALTASSGNNQTAFINTNFPNALTVTVTPNNPLEPVNGGVITFTAPSTGASAILSASAVTISGGIASVTAAANGTVGSYTVSASTTGASKSALFYLTNENHLVLVLDPTDSGALALSGNADISLAGGQVVVDSNAKHALTESGNASITAGSIQVAGGVSISGNATLSPAPLTGQTPMTDPLAYLTAPSTSGLTNYGAANYNGGTHTLNPGIYSSIMISGNASLTLNPGVYAIEGGSLAVSGNASIAGTGVTIYNTSSSTGSFGAITLSGHGTVTLSAPTSGPYGGVVIFQDRANKQAISLSGNAAEGMGGTIYAPAAELTVSGNAKVNGAIVVYELSASGNAALAQSAGGSGPSNADIVLRGQTMTSSNSKSVPTSAATATVADQLFTDPSLLPSHTPGADSSEIASLAALFQQDDASTVKRLDSLLSIEAGAMGISKEILMRDRV